MPEGDVVPPAEWPMESWYCFVNVIVCDVLVGTAIFPELGVAEYRIPFPPDIIVV